jgi:transmembrane 9 superfamily protein 2/4
LRLAQDYRWWWRSFFVASSSSVYIFLYSIFYFVDGLDIVDFVPILVYFVEMIVSCFIYFLCTGTVGFFATYYFLLKIYAAVKVE